MQIKGTLKPLRTSEDYLSKLLDRQKRKLHRKFDSMFSPSDVDYVWRQAFNILRYPDENAGPDIIPMAHAAFCRLYYNWHILFLEAMLAMHQADQNASDMDRAKIYVSTHPHININERKSIPIVDALDKEISAAIKRDEGRDIATSVVRNARRSLSDPPPKASKRRNQIQKT